MTIRQRVQAVVENVAGKPVPSDPEESLFDSGVLDSFALPDVISAIEKEFGVKVPDADLNPRKFDSLTRITAYIEDHAS
jgi:acyl carrier protein